MIVDLTKPVGPTTDPEYLHALVTAIIGQRCFKVDLSYAAELMLHIGDPVSYNNKLLEDEQKGSWILGTRASNWRILLTKPPVIVTSGWWFEPGKPLQPISGEEAERITEQLAGQVIQEVMLSKWHLPTPVGAGMGVIVNFSAGANLAIAPSPEPDLTEEPMSDWELFTPFHMYLRVGPGMVCSYLRSDVLPNTGSSSPPTTVANAVA
jgi:hypothetical protein